MYLTAVAVPPVLRKKLWGAVALVGQQRAGRERELQTAQEVRGQLLRHVHDQKRAQTVLGWLRDPARRQWMSTYAQSDDGAVFRQLQGLCGLSESPDGRLLVDSHEANQQLAMIQGQVHNLTASDTNWENSLDTTGVNDWDRLGEGVLAERLCLAQDINSDAEPGQLIAQLDELQATLEQVEERIQVLQETPRDSPESTAWCAVTMAERICHVQQKTRSWKLTDEEKEAVASATKEREELAEQLRTDSAFSNPLESVLENPITIPRYMASTQHIEQEEAHGSAITVNCNEVMGRLTDDWQRRIREACVKERPRRGKAQIDQEQRVNRFAGYVASVSLFEFSELQRDQLLELILELEGFFNCDPNVPPEWTGGEPYSGLRLRSETPPIQHQERRVPPLALPVVLKQIRTWLETGIVEPSSSPHSSPLLIVAKKALAPPKDPETGLPVADWKPKPRWRICVDYKSVNNRLEAVNMTNAPRLEVCLHQVAACGGRTFTYRKAARDAGITDPLILWLATTCDLVQGFHQITLAPEVRPLTAFTIPGLHTEEGHLQFVCAPFGLSVMPTYFHEMVGRAIGDLHYGHMGSAEGEEKVIPVASHYIDDTYVSTLDTFEGHLAAVRSVFKRLEAVGFGARVDKVEFAQSRLGMLGWAVEEGKIRTDQHKAHKLVSEVGGLEHRLREKKDVMAALGALNFYRTVIPNAAGISAPLYQLTRKGAFQSESDWTPVHSAALRALKEALVADHFLAVPQEHEEFYLVTDASVHSGAAVLAQVQPNGAEHPVSYAGTSFPETARRWSPSERECFVLLWGADYFDQWLKLGRAVFCTDHNPLVGLAKAGRSTNSKLARWSARLAQWSRATVAYRAGVLIGPADMLSRLVYPAKEETPDTRDSLQVKRDWFEPLENTDSWDGTGTRLFGLPMQRLSMLRPPSNTQWLSAKEAYSRATGQEKESQPALHEDQALEKAAQESKADFQKRRDWFQNGHITPEVAVKIIDHAQRVGIAPAMTAEELGNGKYFVTKWRDTRKLDTQHENDAKIEANTRDSHGAPASVLEEKVLVWREFHRTTVAELILEATGIAPEVEEIEYACNVQEQTREQASPHRVESDDGLVLRLADQPDEDADDIIESTDAELRQWLEGAGLEDADGVPRSAEWCFGTTQTAPTTELGECFTVATTTGRVLEEPWESIRRQAIQITQQQCEQDRINNGQIPEPLVAYITALCDPRINTIVCQGGPGTGKTYTATLVAMLMLGSELAHKLMHTRPLVSSGGAGLGFERGSMADKLQYWTRPTKQAAERVAKQCGLDLSELMAQVEAWPIDRTRGISLPSGEWMVADEMQNTQMSLFACMLTRAERGAKVVLCGDVRQCDLPETRKGGMEQIVESWRSLHEAAGVEVSEGD